MSSEYEAFDFEEKFEELMRIIDKLIRRMKENMEMGIYHDYVNLMIVRNELINIRDSYHSALSISILVIESKEHFKHKVIVKCTEPFFMQFRENLVHMYGVEENCAFQLDVCNRLCEGIAMLMEKVYDQFTTMGCWEIYEKFRGEY